VDLEGIVMLNLDDFTTEMDSYSTEQAVLWAAGLRHRMRSNVSIEDILYIVFRYERICGVDVDVQVSGYLFNNESVVLISSDRKFAVMWSKKSMWRAVLGDE
jgi:hypothetical protein